MTEEPVVNVLLRISASAKFTFSYDASIFSPDKRVSVFSKGDQVKSILDKILPKHISYKVSGNHLILLKKNMDPAAANNEKHIISGHVYNSKTEAPLEGIVVYEVRSLISSVTDENGSFSMSVPAQFEQLALSFNQVAVEDTVILLAPHDQHVTVSLAPAREVNPVASIRNMPINKIPSVESLSLVKQLVSDKSLIRAENTDLVLKRVAQVSLFPTIGSNLKMGGVIENDISLNVFIGYAYGTNGFEIGGLFNIIRKDVTGVQVAGIGNVTGGNTRGFQLAGIYNHNRGSLMGLQVSGISSMLIDSLKGIQLSGVNNILRGGMKGGQIAGINNLTTGNVDGFQLSGLTNVAVEDVRKVQVAGLMNIAKNVKGIQMAGLMNLARNEVRGIQLAGIVNKSRNVDAIQFAGIGNISTGTVSGTQVSGIFNYARFVKSTQIGLINIADSASGTPIGLFSFVKNGFRTVEFSSNELMPVTFSFKTGVKRFYNIFSAGYGSWDGNQRWAFGFGWGSERTIKEKMTLSLDYTANWVNENSNFQKDLSLLNRINFSIGYKRHKGLTFTVGPVLNVWLSEWKDPKSGEYLTGLAPYTIVNKFMGTTLFQVWVGGRLAISL